MGAIGPGDVVECVHATPFEPDLKAGARYTIREVVRPCALPCRRDGCLDPGVTLVEVSSLWCFADEGFVVFCQHRFRPIYRREAGAFDYLINPVDERIKEDA